jgi:hypothetical protein
MTRPNYVDITLLIDRSASMAPLGREMVVGLNEFVQAHQKFPVRQDVTFSLVQFDHEFRVDIDAVDLGTVTRFPEGLYQPRGNTAFWDALGQGIDETGDRLRAIPEPDRPSQVLFAVITDGVENASWKYAPDQLRLMVDHQRANYLWQFAFFGANQDSVREGGRIGLKASEVGDWDATSAGLSAVWERLTSRSLAYRRSGKSPIPDFFGTETYEHVPVFSRLAPMMARVA